MEELTIIFAKGTSPFSWLIRAFSWSRWSHVGIIDGTSVIEAKAHKDKDKSGVVEGYLEDFKNRYSRYEIVTIMTPNKEEAIRKARKELGKPYDYPAIFSFLFRRNWENPSKWFCSELVAHCTGIFRNKYVKRITPEDLWRITKNPRRN